MSSERTARDELVEALRPKGGSRLNPERIADLIQAVVREEIASLAGLMLERTGTGAWGEALADFSGHTGDGQEP